MIAHSPVGRFAIRLVLVYGLLIVPWPGLKEGYGTLFRSCGDSLFGSFGSQGVVSFRAPPTKHAAWDTVAHFRKRGNASGWKLEFSAWSWGYLPTAAVVALVFATPAPWKRRWRAMLLALGLVQVFVVLRVAVMLFYSFQWESLFVMSPFWGKFLEWICAAFSTSPVTSFFVPVVIWLLVAFRRADWGAQPEITPPSD